MTDADATGTGGDDPPLLAVEDLETHFPITKGLLRREVGRVRAVDGVSFEVGRGEAFGLVGESGSGKTTTALSTLRLEEPTTGEIRFDGESVTELSGDELRAFRRRAQLVVQDPNEAFNPRMTVGEAVAEPLVLHGMRDADRRRAIVKNLIDRVGLAPEDADRYPHELSGGEKQRIAIARALVLNPDLIVADEPTSALDGRVQARILDLLDGIRREFDVSVLFISHDLDVVRRFCDRVAVMYLGEIVERGRIEDVLESPAHPYTRVLLGSVPSLDPTNRDLARPLTETVPDPADPPSGCRFHPRCPEIVPPAGAALSRAHWRAIAAFRFTLATGERPVPFEDDPDAAQLRARFGLPESDELADPNVARAVEDALEAMARGEPTAALEVLAGAVPSVCEREVPTTTAEEGRRVRCHRYDPAIDAEPRPWSRRAGVERPDAE